MAMFHECDRCGIKINGTCFSVSCVPIAPDLSENPPVQLEICKDCRSEFIYFKEGCAIAKSYRRAPRADAGGAKP